MPSGEQRRGDLLDAYLERKSRLEASWRPGSGIDEVLPGRPVGVDAPIRLRDAEEAAEIRAGMPDRLNGGDRLRPPVGRALPGHVLTHVVQQTQEWVSKIGGSNLAAGSVIQLAGKYKEFKIDSKQSLLAWIDGAAGWLEEDLREVIADWNAECPSGDEVGFADLDGTSAEGFLEENDEIFTPKKVEEKADSTEVEEEASSSSDEDEPVIPRPKDYQKVKEGWGDKQAMFNHCYTYCGETQLVLVQAAEKLGLDPPMLGHGSDRAKSGTAKDAKLWQEFQDYMDWVFADREVAGRTRQDKAKKLLK